MTPEVKRDMQSYFRRLKSGEIRRYEKWGFDEKG